MNKEFPKPETLEAYREVLKEPYAFEYFGIDGNVKKIASFQNWAIGIDDYVMLEMRSNQLQDSLETYQHILKDITKAMGLHPDTTGSVRMGKIYRWINEVIRPQKELELRKKMILQ